MIGFNLSNLQNHHDIELNLNETFDVFSQSSLAELYQEHAELNLKFYVACGVDIGHIPFVAKAAAVAKWHLNFHQIRNPATQQNLEHLAIYQYDKDSHKFKFFCDQVQLATQPFFACLMAEHDSNLSADQRCANYKILANCYHFGAGGAPLDPQLANQYVQAYLDLTQQMTPH